MTEKTEKDRRKRTRSVGKKGNRLAGEKPAHGEHRDKGQDTNGLLQKELSDVFDALREMATGNPYISISEKSSLELVSQLKHHVNLTAENLAEIVDLSHEFAMGLAEHFSVLLRVSKGELDARITGSSSVELLDALKSVTNKMIDSIAEEIGKRKQTEKALEEERQRLFSVLDGLPMYVYLQGPDHSIRFANRFFKEHFGEPQDRPCYEVIAGSDRPCAACRPFSVLQTGQPQVWEWERKNGSIYEIYDYPFIDTDGTTLVLELGIDITKRKQAQREKEEIEAQFYQAQKMEALGILAGSIIHDFNNLLMVIHSDAAMMLRKIDENHPHHERLTSIQTEVRNGAKILDQMLGFAKGGASFAVPADLNEVIQETCGLFGRSKPTIDMQTSFDPNLWKATVDVGRINQVLLNLFINAADAMPQGGKLNVRTKNMVLDEKKGARLGIEPGRYVVFSVQDNGIGMDEKTRRRAFEPFFSTKKHGRATGLGLASVYGIVKDHGGSITLRSEEGKGTQFDVYLPAIE